MRALLPAEWVLIAFGLYSSLYIALFGNTRALAALELTLTVRSKRVATALLIVATIHLARQYWLSPGTVPQALQRRLWVALGLCALPLAFGLWARFADIPYWREVAREQPDEVLSLFTLAVLKVFGLGAPTLAAWFAVATQLKARGTIRWREFGAESLRRLFTTLREWAPLILLISSYAWMEDLIGTPAVERDSWMIAADRVLFFGTDPLDLLQKIIWPPLSEWMAFTYSFYVVFYPVALGSVFMVGGRLALREAVTAMSLALSITFASYALVPVKGPLLTRTFSVPLDLYLIGEVKEAMVDKTRITYDCFPSLHVAGTLVLAWLCYRHAPRVFWWTLLFWAPMPLATVYLRYHYVVDVIAGVALFAGIAWVTPRLMKWWEAPVESRPAPSS